MAKKVVRAIIVNKEGRVLLGKRTGSDASGKWGLIGGKPNEYETIEKAVVREVQEEIGLLFKPTFWMEEVDKESIPGQIWNVYYFYGPIEGDLYLKKEEIEEVKFVEQEDLRNLDMAYDHEKILTKFFKDQIKL